MQCAGVVRIPFRAVPADANETIGLSLTCNGQRVAESPAVGPAHGCRVTALLADPEDRGTPKKAV